MNPENCYDIQERGRGRARVLGKRWVSRQTRVLCFGSGATLVSDKKLRWGWGVMMRECWRWGKECRLLFSIINEGERRRRWGFDLDAFFFLPLSLSFTLHEADCGGAHEGLKVMFGSAFWTFGMRCLASHFETPLAKC